MAATARQIAEKRVRTAAEIRGGMLRMADSLKEGIHRRTLDAMRDAGRLEILTRGLYRLADVNP